MDYQGIEKREFARLDHACPLSFKICKKETVDELFKGYTVNVSQSGILCQLKEKVKQDDILWLVFDRSTLHFCQEIERLTFIYQNGIIGKVVRIEESQDNSFNVGVQFITREEKNISQIYPDVHFLCENNDAATRQ